jgi:predicted nucleic-acid-binding protein|tara:strand:+ start:685 stop:903 length:219 start_codon:yes stop_codon:yes gene_type:complete
MEKKEDTYRRVLIDVIRFLDEGYKHSNTKTRRIVDMVLNHDATYDRAVFVANKEAEVSASLKKERKANAVNS